MCLSRFFGGDQYEAATSGAPAYYTQPDWAYRGMVGPVNAIPLERNGPEGRLLLSGHCSLGWTRGVIHENYTTGGTGEPRDVWNEITKVLRANSELLVGNIVRPTDIGRYLIRVGFSREAATYLARNPSIFSALPGTQSVLKDLQRYAEEADLLFNGLTPVIHFHRPRTGDGGSPYAIFRPHHYRKAKNETERPRANRIVVLHPDSVETIAEEWIDAASIAEWGVISESLMSVAPQATGTGNDIGTAAKRVIMAEQAAAHARRSSESATGATDLSWTEGSRWLVDWRLGDVVRIDDGFNESPDLIVRRVSCQISGDGSFSFTPGFGAQSDVIATLGRNVQIATTTSQERETIRLRKDVEDLKQSSYETALHVSNKQLEARPEGDVMVPPNFRPYNITGDRNGLLWMTGLDESQAIDDIGTARAFSETAVLEASQRFTSESLFGFTQSAPTLQAVPARNITLLGGIEFRRGLDYSDGSLYSIDRVEGTTAQNPAHWGISRYSVGSADAGVLVTIQDVRDVSPAGLNGASVIDGILYSTREPIASMRAQELGTYPFTIAARGASSGAVENVPVPEPAETFNNRGYWAGFRLEERGRDGELSVYGPMAIATNERNGIRRMWVGFSRGRRGVGQLLYNIGLVDQRREAFFQCYELTPTGWVRNSEGDGVRTGEAVSAVYTSTRPVSAWHNGLGSIYYITNNGQLNIANVLDEPSPSLEWSEDGGYEFGLPVGTDGSAVPQLLGAVEATEIEPDPRGARPITYRITLASRAGTQINSVTGEITYIGGMAGSGDSDIRLEVSASVGGFGRRPPISISTTVTISVGGARTIRPQADMRIVAPEGYTFSFFRPQDNITHIITDAFYIENVPADTTPAITITNIQAGSGQGGNTGRTMAAQGSITTQQAFSSTQALQYNFEFQDDDVSEIGNELSFTLNVTAGTQTTSAVFIFNMQTDASVSERILFYATQLNWELSNGFANSVFLSDTDRTLMGGNYTFLWYTQSDSGLLAPLQEVEVSIERVISGDTAITDWSVREIGITTVTFQRLSFYNAIQATLIEQLSASGRILLSYTGDSPLNYEQDDLSPEVHSVVIRVQGRERNILGIEQDAGAPAFYVVTIDNSPPEPPRVVLSDYTLSLKIGASQTIDVASAFSQTDAPIARFSLPSLSESGIVSISETAGNAIDWQSYDITSLRAGRTIISSTASDTANRTSEVWRVFVNVVANVAPVWDNLLWDRTVATNTPAGSDVGLPVTATGENVTYSLLAGRGSPQFSIDESTGQITLARAAPASATNFAIIVRATSNGDVTATADATVNVSVVAPASVKATVNQGWIGGTTLILTVGDTADVNFAEAWISDQPSPVFGFLSADTSIATVSGAGAIATITAVAEGSTNVSGTRTDSGQVADAVSVPVIVIPAAAVSRPSILTWYRLVGGVAQSVNAIAVRIREGAPQSRVLANSLFLAGNEIADRTISLTTPAGGSNIRVGLAADASTIRDSDGTAITAREVSLFLGAVGLDYEDEADRRQMWRVRADAPEYTDTDSNPDVVWRVAQSDLGVNVTLADRDEPATRNASFSVADQTVEMGASNTVDFTGAATDPEGDAIFYAATSSDTTHATVSFAGNILTITGVAVGTATVTWTFQTANSPVVMGGTFEVTVEAPSRVNTTVQFDDATQTYRLPSLAAGPTLLAPNTTARAEAATPAIAGAITYSLSGRDASLYTIDSSTGQITLTGRSPAAGVTHNLIKTAMSAQTATARAGSATQTIVVDFRIARAPRFSSATVSMNLPFGVNGVSPNPPVLVGRVQADEPATYSLSTPVQNFSIDAVSGQIYFHGGSSGIPSTYTSGQLGNGWTLPIAATNAAGTGNIQVLITVKSVVTINDLSATNLAVNIPQSTAAPIQLTTIAGNRLITTRPQTGASASPPTFTFTGPNASRFSITDGLGTDKRINYVGDILTLSATPADNIFTVGLTIAVAENGIALGASRDFTITCNITPTEPVISGPAVSFGFGTASIQDETTAPYEFPELYTATKGANETQSWALIFSFPDDAQRQFSVDATTGRLTYTGPAAIDATSASSGYYLAIGATNTANGINSTQAGLALTINITSAYEPPTVNADWNPGSNWTKGADGSWSGTVARGTPQTINVTSDTSGTGPFTIQSGLTAEYRNESVPTPPTAYSVARSDGSFTITASATQTGAGTLYLYVSDGTTEERLVFHIQVSATATATATTAVWYQDAGAGYAAITDRGVTLNFPEGRASPVSFNIYATYTQIQNRTNATLAEPTLAGFDIVAQTLQRRTLTIASQSVIVDAWTINIDPTMFDFETQSVYDLTATLNVPEYTSGSNTYAAAHKPLGIHLRVSDVNEPPARTAIATPANFALRKQGAVVQFSLNGFWADPEGRSLSYRLTQAVEGASGGQSTTPSDYVAATIIGTDFQASAGQSALETPTGVQIKFSVEAYDGTQYSTPMVFYCTSVHGRALEDSPLAWQSGLPARLAWQVAENITVPYLLRNDIYAQSTVTDQTATAGAITYSLEDAKYWPIRDTDYEWANNAPNLASGGTLTVDMSTAYEIAGPEATGKDFTISGDVTTGAVGSIAINGKSFTLTAASGITTQTTSTFTITAHAGGFTADYVGTLTVTPATAGIAVNAGFSDAAVSLRASASTNVLVSSAFTVTPVGTTWNLSASSSNTAVAAVSVNDATKTLTITAGSSATAGATATITYTGTLGAMTASRTISLTIAAEPVLTSLDAGYTNIAFLENRLYASYAASGGTRRVLRPYNITTGAAELGNSLRTSSISIYAISEGITGQTLATWGYVGNRGDIRLFRYNASAAPALNNQQTADGATGDNANIIDAASLGSAQHPTLLIIGSTTGSTYAKDESGTVYYTTDTSPGIFSTNFSLTALTGTLSTGSAVCADDTNFWVAQKGTANWELKAGTNSNYATDSSKDYMIPISEVPLTSLITSATVVNTEIWMVVHPTPSAISTTAPSIVKVAKPT